MPRRRAVVRLVAVTTGLVLAPAAAVASPNPWVSAGPVGAAIADVAFVPGSSADLVVVTAAGLTYQSSDGGRRWRRTTLAVTVTDVAPGTRRGELAAWGLHGLWVTDDSGRSWRRLLAGRVVSASRARTGERTWVATDGSSLETSSDDGRHWQGRGFPPLATSLTSVAISSDGRWLYAIGPFVAGNAEMSVVWSSGDAGSTWHTSASAGFDATVVVVDRLDPRTAWYAPGSSYSLAMPNLWRTTDAGAVWAFTPGPSSLGPDWASLAVARSSGGVDAVAWSGPSGRGSAIYALDPAGVATVRTTPVAGMPSAFDEADDGTIALVVDSAVVTWAPGAHAWRRAGPAGRDAAIMVAADARHPGVVLLQTHAGLSRSTDFGHTWRSIPLGHGAGFEMAAAGSVSSTVLVSVYPASGVAELWRSADLGQTFSRVPLPGYVSLSMITTPSSATTFYATPSDGSASAFETRDGGRTWRLMSPPETAYEVIAPRPDRASTVWLVDTPTGLAVSWDGLRHVTRSLRGLFESLWALPGGDVVAADAGGLLLRPAAAASWSRIISRPGLSVRTMPDPTVSGGVLFDIDPYGGVRLTRQPRWLRVVGGRLVPAPSLLPTILDEPAPDSAVDSAYPVTSASDGVYRFLTTVAGLYRQRIR